MAYNSIHAITATMNKAIDYITNPKKTVLDNGKQLVSSYGCSPNTASFEFDLTANYAKKIKGDYSKNGGSENLGYHMVQSFSLDDCKKMTAEELHKVGEEFANKFLKGEYEYVIATHIDKQCIHNHIIFNATSNVDYKKFRKTVGKMVEETQVISNYICTQHNLSTIAPKNEKTKMNYKQYYNDYKIRTFKDSIKNIIDENILKSNTYEEFIKGIKGDGLIVKEGKHIAFKTIAQQRFRRGNKIGEDYTKERIIERIENKPINLDIEKPLSQYLSLLQKDKNRNLHKVANAIINCRNENIIYYNQIGAKINDLNLKIRNNYETLEIAKTKSKELITIAKYIETYQRYKPVKDEYDNLKFKFQKNYFKGNYQNEKALEHFEKSKEELEKLGINAETADSESIIEKITENESKINELDKITNEVIEKSNKIKDSKAIIDDFINKENVVKKAQEIKQKQNISI